MLNIESVFTVIKVTVKLYDLSNVGKMKRDHRGVPEMTEKGNPLAQDVVARRKILNEKGW